MKKQHVLGLAAGALTATIVVRKVLSRRSDRHVPTGGVVPFVPTDNTSLADVLAALERDGYRSSFELERDGGLVCLVCQVTTPASSVEIQARRRVEGASDPADMSTILGIQCPSCGSLGSLVVRYGPEAGDDEVAFMSAATGAKAPN